MWAFPVLEHSKEDIATNIFEFTQKQWIAMISQINKIHNMPFEMEQRSISSTVYYYDLAIWWNGSRGNAKQGVYLNFIGLVL